jgi:predicted RNase H-like HicB family nuclease
MSESTKREINIRLFRHSETGRLFATSDDLKGLMVSGRSVDEIEEQLEAAITELLMAHGEHVVGVTAKPASEMPGFQVPGLYRAIAQLAAA